MGADLTDALVKETIFDDGVIRIYQRPMGGKIFIEDVQSGAKIRICSYASPIPGGLQFATEDLVEPVSFGNRIAWRIGPR